MDVTTAELPDRCSRSTRVASRHYLLVEAHGRRTVIAVEDHEELLVGRARECTIRVGGDAVSRRHARLRRRGRLLEIEDLGSRNGTFVDGHRIDGPCVLPAGATVSIGAACIAVVALSDGRDLGPGDGGENRGRTCAAVPLASDLPLEVVAIDRRMIDLFAQARRVARVPATVLVTGETGVGKEIVAEQIHRWSSRAHGPFVRLNCASLPENLLESELFGHERGSFTGASRQKLGYLEAASGGTLFLDEVGEMPLGMQAKLLRVLEARTVTRIGSTHEVPVDVRIVCATNRDLREMVTARAFREDLYFRLATMVVHVPPLRERTSEIPLLAERFASAQARAIGLTPPTLDADVSLRLARHLWPGNVRELRNVMEHAVVMCERARIRLRDLPTYLTSHPVDGGGAEDSSCMQARLRELERRVIQEALEAEGGNQTRAARRLGISRRNLVYKISRYGLRP